MSTVNKTLEQLTNENDLLRARIEELEKSKNEIQNVEIKLKKSELKSRVWLENSPVCTKIVDLDFNLQYMSASGIKELKIEDITEFYGRPYPLYFYPDSFRIPMRNNLEKVKKTGEILEFEGSIIDISGNELWYHSTLVPVNDQQGNLDYIMVVSAEITKRKQAEEKLLIAHDKATESDRLKSAFLATMSHELRTPLNSIIGFSELINVDSSVEEMISFARTINSSGGHLLSIVEDLFDITLIESGEININKSDFNLVSALKDIEAIMKAEQQVLQKEDISLNLIFPPKSNDLIIATDLPKLKQILINLLKNALKFTHEGLIKFGYIIETYKDKPMLKFFVEDTGIGIPENKQELIFDVFRQLDDTHTRVYGGTGIGLSISKKLTEFLGGKIWLESEEGKGSTFYFTIPYTKLKSSDKPDEIEISVIAKSIPLENNTPMEKTILIVEDDEASFEFLKILLENKGVTTYWAKDGKESIKYCKENPDIDLVLMDINMMNMNGYTATKKIKKFRPDLPIIAQTAYAIAGDREKAFDAGCDDYISKPIKKEILMEKIGKWL